MSCLQTQLTEDTYAEETVRTKLWLLQSEVESATDSVVAVLSVQEVLDTIGQLEDDCTDIVIVETAKSGWAATDSGKNFVMYPFNNF